MKYECFYYIYIYMDVYKCAGGKLFLTVNYLVYTEKTGTI